MPDLNDLNQFGPVKFSVEGTFTDKPRLLMNGEEIAYDSLFIMHNPEHKFEDFDGKDVTIPASTNLDFSVSTTIGQLEAHVTYRVKANDENGLVLVKSDKHDPVEDAKKEKKKKGGKPDFFKKKKDDKEAKAKKPDFMKKKDDKKSEDKKDDKKDDKKGGKPDFFKKKNDKSKSDIVADPLSPIGQQQWREDLRSRLANE